MSKGILKSFNIEENTTNKNNAFNTSSDSSVDKKILVILIIVGLLLGSSTYLFLLKEKSTATSQIITENSKAKKAMGIKDKKLFPDSAEGVLREGGIDGEGNFHLERPGGESQYVYLTSSVIDLSLFIGKKVKVFGKTFQAQKAGWLMDVGYIETIE